MLRICELENLYTVSLDYAEFNFARDSNISGNPDNEPLTFIKLCAR